jgi:hypothetical protein
MEKDRGERDSKRMGGGGGNREKKEGGIERKEGGIEKQAEIGTERESERVGERSPSAYDEHAPARWNVVHKRSEAAPGPVQAHSVHKSNSARGSGARESDLTRQSAGDDASNELRAQPKG